MQWTLNGQFNDKLKKISDKRVMGKVWIEYERRNFYFNNFFVVVFDDGENNVINNDFGFVLSFAAARISTWVNIVNIETHAWQDRGVRMEVPVKFVRA